MTKALILIILFGGCMNLAYGNTNQWITAYEDEEISIEIKNDVEPIDDDVASFTFRWTWAKLHALKKTQGVSYKSRIEETDINFREKKYKTQKATLFDSHGRKIHFDSVVPSTRWDDIEAGSIMDKVHKIAFEILEKNK